MSVVEEVRQLFQDFIAPELRAFTARVDALEKVMEARFEEMGSRFKEVDSRFKEIDSRFKEIDSRFKEVDSRFTALESRFIATDTRVESRFSELSFRLQTLQETVDRNDSSQKLLITKLTQDFEFDKRLTEIEREIHRNKSTAA